MALYAKECDRLFVEADELFTAKPEAFEGNCAIGEVFTWFENFQPGFDGWSSLLSGVLRIVAMRLGGAASTIGLPDGQVGHLTFEDISLALANAMPRLSNTQ